MRGFVVGSLALIALYTVVTNATNAGTVLTFTQSLVERALSPAVGGVPNMAARGAPAPAAAPAPSGPVNPTFARHVNA